ncbi:MFS transporter [Deminuibacter soli]|uniref:MFS transporter n=1 Tax=Deminuibacter soli TaxID=2291815 RepID=A0A3E1NL35_9BACT|nr:MFS transporter [Deminuibacter soli]RFM28649.1 MFS transporter [Deminuibacter soli]
MQQSPDIFKSWAPGWLIKLVLICCMVPSMMLLGLYNSNVTYASSFLDVEPEDMQYAICITYATLVATVLIENRFFKYFSTRNYFIGISFISALVLILSAWSHHYYQFLPLRFAEGVCMALPGGSLRQLLLSKYKSKNAVVFVYTFFYGILLLSSGLTMHLVVWMLDRFTWQHMAVGMALFHVLCMGLLLLVFNGNRLHKKIPLYRVDWVSYILLLCAMFGGSYVLVYGEKLYWFQSPVIIGAAVLALVTGALFTLRQLHRKRPGFNFAVTQYANLRTGVCLFILFYISRATLNICHSTMSRVWNWEPLHVAAVQYINMGGIVAGLIFSIIALHYQVRIKRLLAAGFLLLAVYHIWFTFLFVPDVALSQITIPYLLQGMAVGMLFVPLVLFTVSSVPATMAVSAGIAGVSARFWGNTLGFSVFQNAQVYLQQQHYSKLQQFISPESPVAQQRVAQGVQSFMGKGFSADEAMALTVKQLNNATVKQSMLLSNMELFTVVGIGLLVAVVLILANQHLKNAYVMMREKTEKVLPRTLW